MKKLLFLLLVTGAVWLYCYRERIYIHDVVAKVSVGGVEQADMSAYINASNNVLLMSPAPPTLLLVRHGDAAPILEGTLTCVHWVACMTEAGGGTPSGKWGMIVMSSKGVTFVNDAGKTVQVQLY
jgi:hypothetical protein